jgi:hypothetical protein
MKNRLLVVFLLSVSVFFLSNFTIRLDHAKSYHSHEELQMFQNAMQNPIGPGDYFLTSQSCRGCHGFDSLGLANIDENGVDINLFDHWEGSMMALSAKDPFWRAKVSHEILTNPAHAVGLQTKCTSCHAPMGHYDAYIMVPHPTPFLILSMILSDWMVFPAQDAIPSVPM